MHIPGEHFEVRLLSSYRRYRGSVPLPALLRIFRSHQFKQFVTNWSSDTEKFSNLYSIHTHTVFLFDKRHQRTLSNEPDGCETRCSFPMGGKLNLYPSFAGITTSNNNNPLSLISLPSIEPPPTRRIDLYPVVERFTRSRWTIGPSSGALLSFPFEFCAFMLTHPGWTEAKRCSTNANSQRRPTTGRHSCYWKEKQEKGAC